MNELLDKAAATLSTLRTDLLCHDDMEVVFALPEAKAHFLVALAHMEQAEQTLRIANLRASYTLANL